jgi:hypothetical protein
VACSASRCSQTVFTSHGSYASPQAYVDGLVPAIWVGVAVLALGALIAALLPFNTRESTTASAVGEPVGGANAPAEALGGRQFPERIAPAGVAA